MPPIIFIIMSDLFGAITAAASQATENLISRAQSTIDSHTAYKRQKKLMAYQNQFNIQQWERENEYNLPINIRKRLEDAGINPYTAMTGGNSSPVSNISPVGLGSAPAVPTPHTSSLADVILNARQVSSNIKVNEATESKILAEKDKAEAEAAEIRSRTPKEHNTGDVQNRYTISQTPTEKNTGDVQNEYTSALTEGQRISNILNGAKIQFANETAQQEFELLCYSVINAQIDGDMKRATAQKMLAEALLANTRANGQKTSNFIAEKTANELIERTNADNRYWKRLAELGGAKGATPVQITMSMADMAATKERERQSREQRRKEFREFMSEFRANQKRTQKLKVPVVPLKTPDAAVKDFKQRNPHSGFTDSEIRSWLRNYYIHKGRYKVYKPTGKKYVWYHYE